MERAKAVDVADLDIGALDAESPVPLYHQIENDLRRLIGSGALSSNVTLPPEKELCRAYGVSRHTMRKALARLVADDLISRRAGRGTMVTMPSDRMEFYLDRSFTRQMADMGRRAHSKVLKHTISTIDDTCPSVFREHVGSQCLHLVRIRFGDDEPIGLQSSVILMERCPGLEQHDFNRESLYDVLSTEYHMAITEIRHTISAVVADEFQAQLLQIEHNAPLLLVKTTASMADGQVVEFTVTYYRADRYEYRTTDVYSRS